MDLVGFSKAGESQFGWATRFFFISSVSLLLSFLCILCQGTYNVFFHPLHKYPGPRMWIAFPIFRHIASLRGVLDRDIRHLHEEYGTVVRFSANQLSFITAHAWKDIYGHGHPQLPKFLQANPGKAPDIINSNDADHARFRKALAHGFSEKALSRQEPLMMIYINLLIEKLRDVAISGHKTDMVQWYNRTTFDIIGDLAFGTPFESLKNNRLHSWISMIFKAVKLGVFFRTMREYPLIAKPVMFLMAGNFRKSRIGARAHVRDTVMRRIKTPELEGRGDFMDAIRRHKGGSDGLSVDELVANANILIIAGSETTATLLSGVIYLLLKNSRCLRKVTGEVRGAFEKEEEINFVNASSRLPYMLACLDEALRMYPPVPSGLERVIPPGPSVEVAGNELPSGAIVSVHQLAAYTSSLNFTSPNSYLPERWLHPTPSRFADDNRAVFQPFSVGPRNCVGRNLAYNEMRMILARLVWNFDLELCPESENWTEQKIFFLWEKPPLFLKLKWRRSVGREPEHVSHWRS